MSETLRRAIVVTVVTVGPRVPRADQWFVISVSAGLRGADGLTETEREKYRPLLQPWNWGWAEFAEVKAFARRAPADANAAQPNRWLPITKSAPDQGKPVERARPELADDMLAIVQSWLDKENAPELRLDPPEATFDNAQASAPTFAQQLAQLSTYPGALPQQLGLVSYVKLAFPPELDGHEVEIVIAPTITTELPGTLALARKADDSDWEYRRYKDSQDLAGELVPDLEPVVKPLLLTTKLADGSLGPDPSKAWVRLINQDAAWSEQLELGCNAVVDLVARIAQGLEDVRGDGKDTDTLLDDGSAQMLLQAALRYHLPDDPWPLLEALVVSDGGEPLGTPYPVIRWDEVIREGGRGTSTADLAALAPGVDILWWLWRWAPHKPDTRTPNQLTFQEGRVNVGGTWVSAPGAKRRDEARTLAEKIVRATRTAQDDGEALEPYAAAIAESRTWLLAATPRLKRLLRCEESPSNACAWLDKHWPTAVETAVTSLWETLLAAKQERPLPALKPHGITVQLDEVSLEGDPEDADLWKDLAGIALFVKRERPDNKSAWKLANGATVRARGAADVPIKEWPELYKAPVVVPTSLPFQNGVRSPFVTYEHRSLVAHAALDSGGGARESAASTTRAQIVYTRPIQPSPSGAMSSPVAMMLPQLRYGDTYSMAVACFDLGGGAPAEMCEGVPWKLRADYSLSSEPAYQATSIEYKRAVPIGQVRFARTDESKQQDVPPNVYPLARELPREPRKKDEPQRPEPMLVVARWDRGRKDQSSTPILSMNVRAPSVDIDVLERTVGVEKALPAQRYLKDRRGKALPPKANPASAFDDPAVTKLSIKIEKLVHATAGTWGKPDEVVVDLPSSTNYVTDGITIDCWFAESTTIAGDGSKITLGVTAAELAPDKALPAVFRIELSPWIGESEAKLCKPELLATARKIGKDFVLPGHVLLVERASPRMPTGGELAKWFKQRVPDKLRREIELYVEAPSAQARVLDNIRTTEVLRHVWRWDGRPRMRWPEAWPLVTTDVDRSKARYREWEETAFIDIDPENGALPSDALRIPVARFVYGTDAKAPALLHESWDRDQIAHYVRYVLRVQSRYVGMWEAEKTAHTVMGVEVVKDGDTSVTAPAWRAVFLPPRPATPRVPVIRAIIPLTGVDPKLKASGVMVVLDEPMFRDHGVSEGIVAQIDTSLNWLEVNPGTPPTPPTVESSEVLEYGHDPIITPRVMVGLPKKPHPVELFGPYGVTLDTDSNPSPLFGASCYLLEPPFSGSEPWDFARMRFRRVLYDNTPTPQAGSETEWTRPYWIQFVAPSGELAPSEPLLDKGVVKGLGSETEGFGLYAIVTGRIRAYHGGQGDELYLDAFPIKNGQGKLRNDRPDLELYVRVCEIQPTTPLATEKPPEDLWEALFPENPSRDAWARITRLSPPRPIRRV